MDHQRTFTQNETRYLTRLGLACACTAISIITLRITVAGGAGTHWVEALLLGLLTAGAAMFFTLDALRHFHHTRRMGVVQDAIPYGFAGPEPEQSAVDKLRRAQSSGSKRMH